MRVGLALFALVGAVATLIDLGLFWLLARAGTPFVVADLVALAGAATWSWVANASITFRRDRDARWVREPSLFAAMALFVAAVDVAVLAAMHAVGAPLNGAKLAALLVAMTVRWTAYRRVLFTRVRRELALRSDRGPAPGDRRLTVVVPAFCEQDRIAVTLASLREVLERRMPAEELELLVVDDGSPDATAVEAERAGADTVIRLDCNRGKGAAVRAGVLAARGRSVVFTDADLAYPPESVLAVLAALEEGWDVVVGSRRHEHTTTLARARRLRELGGRVVNGLTRLVLLGRFRDTQCGLKGFRSEVGRSIFGRTRIDGFAFDVEIFLIAEQDRLSLLEVPVHVTNRASSSVDLVGDSARLVRDLFRIRRWVGRGLYRPPTAGVPAGGTPTAPRQLPWNVSGPRLGQGEARG